MHERCAAAFSPIIITRTEFEFIPVISVLFLEERKSASENDFCPAFVRFFSSIYSVNRKIYVVIFFFFLGVRIFVEDSEFAFKEVNFGDKVARMCTARKEMLRRNW